MRYVIVTTVIHLSVNMKCMRDKTEEEGRKMEEPVVLTPRWGGHPALDTASTDLLSFLCNIQINSSRSAAGSQGFCLLQMRSPV
jgi:hypothetical protein